MLDATPTDRQGPQPADPTPPWARRTLTPLLVGPDTGWAVRGDGRLVDLRRRGAMRRMLTALVDARHPEGAAAARPLPFTAFELSLLAWPGHRLDPDAACRRTYVEVARLRKVLLEDALVTTDQGYALDPSLVVVRSSGRAPLPARRRTRLDGLQNVVDR